MIVKQVAWLCLSLIWLVSAVAQDDPLVGFFSGEFDGKRYRMTMDRFSATAYDGILQIDDDRFQLDASRYGERVKGVLRNETKELRFRARLEGSALILEMEDGRRVVLWRTNSP